MHPSFTNIVGFEEVMKICKLNPDDEADCAVALGMKWIDAPKTALDAFVSAELIPSKSEFRKNPRPLWINGNKVDATAPWTFGVTSVLLCGKRRTDAVAIRIRKAVENDDGTIRVIGDNAAIV